MRVLATLAAATLGIPALSAIPASCPDAEANGVLSKFRQYILPAPDAPEHRWMVSKAEEGWRLTEYSGLRVFVRCRPVSKADELNGFQYGEVEFRYDASRSTRWPEVTPEGLQWEEWSEWTDSPKPLTKAQDAEQPPLLIAMYRLAVAADSRDRRIPYCGRLKKIRRRRRSQCQTVRRWAPRPE